MRHILLTLIFIPAFSFAQEDDLPTAVMVEWPPGSSQIQQHVEYGPVKLGILRPANIKSSGTDGMLVLVLDNKTELYLETEKASEYMALMGFDFSKSQYRMIDKPLIQYTAPQLHHSLSKHDKDFRNRHLEDRKALFHQDSKLYIVKRKGLTIYYSDERANWWTAQAIITLDHLPNQIITLRLRGNNFSFFKEIIANIKQK